ncbi:helix-turn-helix domain-containing protein [Paraburkholderia sp. GAS348]|uniref:helix-turn-helix domain-containing protein n=1 Tax=Paraburkholderia sp. GAS348 TaxID=3035132 RepID=UPI003D203C75
MNLRHWNDAADGAQIQTEQAPLMDGTRQIALLILDECPLSEAAAVAETYQRWNESLPYTSADAHRYSVHMLSTQKGFVSCASSIRLFAENIDDFDPRIFKSIFVGGGGGTCDPRVASWLAQAGPEVELIAISADAHDMLAATGLLPATALGAPLAELEHGARGVANPSKPGYPEVKLAQGEQALHRLLATVERDFGVLVRIRSEILRANRSLTRGGAAPTSVRGTVALSERIEASVLWIKSNHAGSVSISELARRASMSERNFLRRFKSEIGQTPHEYLARVRLENAQLLLVQTDLPVDKIARRCGLFNGDHLRKYFLKYLAVSPVEYRMLARDRAVSGKAPNGVNSGT